MMLRVDLFSAKGFRFWVWVPVTRVEKELRRHIGERLDKIKEKYGRAHYVYSGRLTYGVYEIDGKQYRIKLGR